MPAPHDLPTTSRRPPAAGFRPSSRSSSSGLSQFEDRLSLLPQLDTDTLQQLIRDAQAGMAARDRLAAGQVPRTEIRQLRRQVADGEAAAERVAGSMWRLVRKMCKEQAEERWGERKAQLELDDLFAEGMLVVVESIRTYDPARAANFPAWAGSRVRHHIRNILGVKETGTLKVSAAWSRARRMAQTSQVNLTARFGRTPTLDELRDDMYRHCMAWAEGRLSKDERRLPEQQREELKIARLRKQGMLGAIERIDEVLAATQTVMSLDVPAGVDSSASLGDLLPGGQLDGDLLDQVEHQVLAEQLSGILAEFDEREQSIIRHRYGFEDGEVWTFQAIGRLHNVTPERVRQIEAQVIARLRAVGAARDTLHAWMPQAA